MQRPRRIAVFGVLSLIVGGFILIHNLDQLGVALKGPEAITIPSESEAPGQVGEMMRDTARAMRGALNEPVYRGGLGLKSALSAAMALVLIAAGGGLMRNKMWPIQLTRVWAWFSIGAAIVTVLMQSRYVVPNIPMVQGTPGMGGAHYVGLGVTLLLMCLYPILLLRVLPSEAVLVYLKQQQADGTNIASIPMMPTQQPPTDQPPPLASEQQSTWRDDPWNDPTSQ